MKNWMKCSVAIAAGLALSSAALAKSTPEEIAKLGGKDYTCTGAERAGNDDGVAEFTGKWLGAPTGVAYSGTGDPYPNPYASEKPLYVVTQKNMAQYAKYLNPGMQALLKKYPTYTIPVYASHRDFRQPDWICDRAKLNAKDAEMTDGGLGLKANRGAVFFPFPKTGLELASNFIWPARTSEQAVYDVAVVYGQNKITWGRQNYRIYAPSNYEDALPTTTVDNLFANANVTIILPLRDAGTNFVTTDGYNSKTQPRVTFGYDPGTRRVRQFPAFGFDSPDPATSGFRTIDEDRLFNGSTERYDWKIVGKKSMIVPYNAYSLDDPKIKYSELTTAGHMNNEHARFEMHRVWVLEATLKPNFRHKYARRTFYIDEDSWQAVANENYDSRGQLWRVGMVHLKYLYDAKVYFTRVSTYNDMTNGTYAIDRLINEAPQTPKYGKAAGLTPSMFTPDYARRMGR